MKNDKNPTLEYLEITSMGIPFFDLKAGKVYKLMIRKTPESTSGFFSSILFFIKK